MQCVTPISIIDKSDKNPRGLASKRLNVPCGRCGICKKNLRNQWTFRLREELKHSINGRFITLTYDEKNVPYNKNTGELSLYKKHVQDFIKRLRESEKRRTGYRRLKYYAVGEYGSQTHRPHYHIIIFNLSQYAINNLTKWWDKGHIDIGTISPASIHYVAKYHVLRNHLSDEDDIVPEFAIMSQGLGKQYIDNNRKYHRETGNTFVYLDGYRINMPKYFKEKIWTKEELANISDLNIENGYIEEKKEHQRLKKLGYEDPFREKWLRDYHQSQKIKHKHDPNDTKL